MKVKAIDMGFYRGARVRPGEVFDLQEGDKPGKWMADPVTGQPLRGGVMLRNPRKIMKTVIRDSKPLNTLSEMGRGAAAAEQPKEVKAAPKLDGRSKEARALRAAKAAEAVKP